MRRTVLSLSTLGVVVLGSTAPLSPGPAAAADGSPHLVEVGDGYHFRGFAEHNDVLLTVVDGRLLVHDRGATELGTLTPRCAPVPVPVGAAVSCRLRFPTVFHADLGDGDDWLQATEVPASVRLDVRTGDGHNVVWGGPGNDVIRGESTMSPGGDTLYGDGGNDRLTAGTSGAYLRGHAGNDVIVGGPGIDFVIGDQGDDYVRAGEDPDYISGGAGNDGLSGDGGNDSIQGGRGNDQLFGVSGDDDLVGNAGRDTLNGQEGDDVLRARDDERDTVSCGSGDDVARVDFARTFLGFPVNSDRVAQCERIRLGDPPDEEPLA